MQDHTCTKNLSLTNTMPHLVSHPIIYASLLAIIINIYNMYVLRQQNKVSPFHKDTCPTKSPS